MATTRLSFSYKKILTDQDIIEHAREIAEASKKIQQIKESQEEIKKLQEKIVTRSKYIQDGEINEWTRGVFEWHTPSPGKVTVSYDQGYGTFWEPFTPFTRDMTEEELKEHCELEIPFEAPTEVLARKIKSIAMEADDYGMSESANETDDEQDISEIFGVTTNDDPPQPDSTPTPEPESTPEDPAPAYRIEQCESTKYPWNILEGSGKEAVIFERFRTKEQAETFLTLFNENKIPENSPGAEWIMEKGLGGWKVKKCQYDNGKLVASTFHTMTTCYFDAKEMCDTFNNGGNLWTAPELKVVSDNAKYQIVENPDGSLKTILKPQDEEVKA